VSKTIACSFSQVVVLLLIDLHESVVVFWRYTVTIANDHLCLWHVSDGTVAGNDMLGMV
jgi:hypothetical protein